MASHVGDMDMTVPQESNCLVTSIREALDPQHIDPVHIPPAECVNPPPMPTVVASEPGPVIPGPVIPGPVIPAPVIPSQAPSPAAGLINMANPTVVEISPPSKIPRPANAFMIFANEWRKQLAAKYPKENNKEVSKRLGEMWKNLPKVMKDGYFNKAKRLDAEHKRKYPNYVYNPMKARVRKAMRDQAKAHGARRREKGNSDIMRSLGYQLPPKQGDQSMMYMTQQLLMEKNQQQLQMEEERRNSIRQQVEQGMMAFSDGAASVPVLMSGDGECNSISVLPDDGGLPDPAPWFMYQQAPAPTVMGYVPSPPSMMTPASDCRYVPTPWQQQQQFQQQQQQQQQQQLMMMEPQRQFVPQKVSQYSVPHVPTTQLLPLQPWGGVSMPSQYPQVDPLTSMAGTPQSCQSPQYAVLSPQRLPKVQTNNEKKTPEKSRPSPVWYPGVPPQQHGSPSLCFATSPVKATMYGNGMSSTWQPMYCYFSPGGKMAPPAYYGPPSPYSWQKGGPVMKAGEMLPTPHTYPTFYPAGQPQFDYMATYTGGETHTGPEEELVGLGLLGENGDGKIGGTLESLLPTAVDIAAVTSAVPLNTTELTQLQPVQASGENVQIADSMEGSGAEATKDQVEVEIPAISGGGEGAVQVISFSSRLDLDNVDIFGVRNTEPGSKQEVPAVN